MAGDSAAWDWDWGLGCSDCVQGRRRAVSVWEWRCEGFPPSPPGLTVTVVHARRYENVLFLKEAECALVVALSGSDEVVCAPTVRKYLESHNRPHTEVRTDRRPHTCNLGRSDS